MEDWCLKDDCVFFFQCWKFRMLSNQSNLLKLIAKNCHKFLHVDFFEQVRFFSLYVIWLKISTFIAMFIHAISFWGCRFFHFQLSFLSSTSFTVNFPRFRLYVLTLRLRVNKGMENRFNLNRMFFYARVKLNGTVYIKLKAKSLREFQLIQCSKLCGFRPEKSNWDEGTEPQEQIKVIVKSDFILLIAYPSARRNFGFFRSIHKEWKIISILIFHARMTYVEQDWKLPWQ